MIRAKTQIGRLPVVAKGVRPERGCTVPLITAKGAVAATADQFTAAVVSGTVQPRSGRTPFAATGSLPIWVFALITLVLGRDRA